MKWLARLLVFLALTSCACAQTWLPLSSVPAPTVWMDFAGNYSTGCSGAFTNCLSVTNDGHGTATTLNGTVVPFATPNTLRITDQGLLIEEARTNLALQSQNFANAQWQTFAGSAKVGAAPVNSPDGTLNAYEVSFGSTGGAIGSASAIFNSGMVFTSGSTYTGTIYVMAKSGSTSIRVALFDGAGVNSATADTTVTNGGWTRIPVSLLSTNGASGSHIDIRNNVAGNSANVYIAFAQAELGAFPTSYIPTTTVAVARAADVVKLIGNAASPLSAPATVNGSIVVGALGAASVTGGPIVVDADGANNNFIYLTATTTVRSFAASSNITATLGSGSSTSTTKFALGFGSAGISLAGNGGSVATSATKFNPSSVVPYVGSGGGAGAFYNGYIRNVAVWNSRLSDATLQALTQ